MTRNSRKDDNDYPTIFGVSCVDGLSPVRITLNSSAHGMLIDTATVISVVPSVNFPDVDDNSMNVAKGVSSTDSTKVLPWYVNPTNGAVLVDLI